MLITITAVTAVIVVVMPMERAQIVTMKLLLLHSEQLWTPLDLTLDSSNNNNSRDSKLLKQLVVTAISRGKMA